jgi:hypothetical protein
VLKNFIFMAVVLLLASCSHLQPAVTECHFQNIAYPIGAVIFPDDAKQGRECVRKYDSKKESDGSLIYQNTFTAIWVDKINASGWPEAETQQQQAHKFTVAVLDGAAKEWDGVGTYSTTSPSGESLTLQQRTTRNGEKTRLHIQLRYFDGQWVRYSVETVVSAGETTVSAIPGVEKRLFEIRRIN